jgi:hypothetical protein
VTLKDILEVSNVLVLPAFGYIVLLERRITKMQTQLDLLLAKLRTFTR